MRTFTTSDPIFERLAQEALIDRTALQNFVDGLNHNAHANAVFSSIADRGDAVFELVAHADLKENGAGAQYSNDRDTKEFRARESRFAIQLDKDWFISSSSTITKADGTTQTVESPAAWSSRKGAAERLAMTVHEGDHANHQA